MEKRPEINWNKQDNHESNRSESTAKVDVLQRRHDDIKSICKQLSSDSFDVKTTYVAVVVFLMTHKRWLYSDVSSYLFACSEKELSNYISNLDQLQEYAYLQLANCPSSGEAHKKMFEKITASIDKLWDHSNLAQTQNQSLHDSDETFAARFNKNLIPFRSEFAHEMNMQFISLIAIFTALSFLVFGGISSLDNLFTEIGHVPIIELMIVGCIWSICILNLVFVFIYLVAKLTKSSIKSTETEGAPLAQRYPFFVWSNYLLVLILAVCCWLYFIDYANAGGWLLTWSRQHDVLSAIIGLAVIGTCFGTIAKFLVAPRKKRDVKPTDNNIPK